MSRTCALYADGFMFALPVAVVAVYVGWRYVKSGSQGRVKAY